MIRIDTFREGPSLVMHVAGSVAGPDVAVLAETVKLQGLPHRIELTEVEFVDAEGVRALLGLEKLGTRLVDTGPYVELLLRTGAGAIEG